ncbi:hypothetical protein ES702_02480 [subsurface metagenome]
MGLAIDLVERHFEIHNGEPPEGNRAEVYRSLEWELKNVSLSKLGVWDRAQGMPHRWCMGNVLETAEHYRKNKHHEGHYHKNVEALASMVPDIVLDTIIVVDGRTRRGREKSHPHKWNIDDGCMRALTYALRGFKNMKAYVGETMSRRR